MARGDNSTRGTGEAQIESLDGPVLVESVESSEPVHPEGGKGRTLLRARRGYAYDPSVEGIPTITASGVYVTATQADEILGQDGASAIVYKHTPEGE